jgi:hypothetical protein
MNKIYFFLLIFFTSNNLFNAQCNYRTIIQEKYLIKQFEPKTITNSKNEEFGVSIMNVDKNIMLGILTIFHNNSPKKLNDKITFEFADDSWLDLYSKEISEPELINNKLLITSGFLLSSNDIDKLKQQPIKNIIIKFDKEYQQTLQIQFNHDYIKESIKCFSVK